MGDAVNSCRFVLRMSGRGSVGEKEQLNFVIIPNFVWHNTNVNKKHIDKGYN